MKWRRRGVELQERVEFTISDFVGDAVLLAPGGTEIARKRDLLFKCSDGGDLINWTASAFTLEVQQASVVERIAVEVSGRRITTTTCTPMTLTPGNTVNVPEWDIATDLPCPVCLSGPIEVDPTEAMAAIASMQRILDDTA